MNQLIDEVKTIPGVVGACLYSAQKGLQGSNLPKFFKPERLAAIGKQLFKLHSAGRMSFDDLTDLSLHYDESVVVVRELHDNLLIFAICDPSFNHNLLTMSFNLLQEEVKGGNYNIATTAAGPVTAGAETTTSAPIGLAPDSRLLDLLAEMKKKLGKVLGPMAGFIFDETLESWQQQGVADARALASLLKLIETEIADEDKITHYRSLIAPDLRAFEES